MSVRRLAICLCVLLAAAAGAAWMLRVRTRQGGDPAGVQTVRVERGPVELTVSADGTLKPLTTVTVKSYAGGRVDVLAVDVGDRVKPGDLIAKIDPTDSLTSYEQARADLSAAEAKLHQARDQAEAQPTLTRAAIAQAEASYGSVGKELQRLQQATQPQTRSSARATLDKAKANLEVAEQELGRAQGLKAQGFVAQAEVDTAINKRDLAQAELASAQERWDTLEQELRADLEAAQAKVAQAKAALDNARANAVQDRLKQADVVNAQAAVARAEAQVVNAKTMLDYTTIRAPRAGVILTKLVEQGTIITSGRSSIAAGTDIVELGDLSKMFVEVSVDESDVGKLRLKQPVSIEGEAFPDTVFHGVVTRIDPQASTQQNITTVLVTVQVEDAGDTLKPGMTASCDFLVAKADDALSLPSRAVQEAGGRHFVTVVRGNELSDMSVEIGVVGDDRTEIVQGLREGDEVVQPGLIPGDQRTGTTKRDSGPPPPPGGGGSFFRGGR
jgi:HlyD family secretion protein